jgi:hypothetical protein
LDRLHYAWGTGDAGDSSSANQRWKIVAAS